MSIPTVGCVLAGCHTQPKASVLIQPSDSVAGNRLTAPGGSADNSAHRSLIHAPNDRAEPVTETGAPKPAASGQKAEDFSARPHQSDSDQRRTSSSSLGLATLDNAARPSANRPRSQTTVGGLYWSAQQRPAGPTRAWDDVWAYASGRELSSATMCRCSPIDHPRLLIPNRPGNSPVVRASYCSASSATLHIRQMPRCLPRRC